MSAVRVFYPEFFFNIPLRTQFYLDAVLGGPSCFAGGRLKFIKTDWRTGTNGKIAVEVDSDETVWIRDYVTDPAKTVRVPRFKGVTK